LWLVLLCAGISLNAQAQYDRGESSGDFALPVTLLNFSAVGEDHAIMLQWTTASEIDLVGFNLYRSEEPIGGFTCINPTIIPSRGAGPEINEYQYLDDDVASGSSYFYKLSSLELDGSEVFLGSTITGNPSHAYGDMSFALKGSYPDPFNGQASIVFSVKAENRVSLTIYDINGRVISILVDRILAPGEYVETFHGDHLPSGVYLCRMQSEGGYNYVHKMILLR
jgi:hypothetical protein